MSEQASSGMEAGHKQHALVLIHEAIHAVESLGAADWLTTAVTLLANARGLLETDGKYPSPPGRGSGERTNFPPMSSGLG